MGDPYQSQYDQVAGLISEESALKSLRSDINRFIMGEETEPSAIARLAERAAASGVAGWGGGGGGSDKSQAAISLSILDDQLKGLTKEIDTAITGAYNVSPQRAVVDFPWAFDPKQRALAATGGIAPAAAAAPPSLQFIQGPGGALFSANPRTGTVTKVGDFPELREKQVVTDNRTGMVYALDPYSGERIELGQYGYAEVDPKVKFSEDIRQFNETLAIQKRQVEAQFIQLELSRRGQMVEALSQDMAHQIELGRLTYTEASLNLDRVDRALTQRRAERQDLLQYGVTRASLSQNALGETVTTLPGAAQLAAILGGATGQMFGSDFGKLGVGAINPQQAGQDVLNGSAYQSPIPGLVASLGSTREQIGAILGAPLAGPAVAAGAAEMVAQGV